MEILTRDTFLSDNFLQIWFIQQFLHSERPTLLKPFKQFVLKYLLLIDIQLRLQFYYIQKLSTISKIFPFKPLAENFSSYSTPRTFSLIISLVFNVFCNHYQKELLNCLLQKKMKFFVHCFSKDLHYPLKNYFKDFDYFHHPYISQQELREKAETIRIYEYR